MRIGIAGLGRMGAAIALRLHETRHDLAVWNRSPDKARDVAAETGAEFCANPAALSERADVVITMLTDADALDAVYRGPSGLLAGPLGGKLVIDMSTVQPAAEIAIGTAVQAKGGAFVECPVGGTTGPARQGKLIGLVGGAEADVARARPILEHLCRRIEHVGRIGTGASMKLAINLPLLVYYQALGEALTLCRNVGREPQWLMDLFADTAGGPNLLKVRGPAIAEALGGGEPSAAFDVGSIRKDLRAMVAEAGVLGTTLPLAERALAVYDEAAEAGWNARDGAALPSYWPKRAE